MLKCNYTVLAAKSLMPSSLLHEQGHWWLLVSKKKKEGPSTHFSCAPQVELTASRLALACLEPVTVLRAAPGLCHLHQPSVLLYSVLAGPHSPPPGELYNHGLLRGHAKSVTVVLLTRERLVFSLTQQNKLTTKRIDDFVQLTSFQTL